MHEIIVLVLYMLHVIVLLFIYRPNWFNVSIFCIMVASERFSVLRVDN